MSKRYTFFTSKEIKPLGWTQRQLRLQADGLAGNLDKVWPDVRDSMWIGGSCEGWERVPYWLDGFVPLAYLLDDADMQARAKHYIDKILEFQRPDGWICPNGETPLEKYDTWAVLLISKVLTVYYECSGDKRIPGVIRRIMKNYYDLLSSGEIKLFGWGEHRWFEGFVALNFLKKRYPRDKWVTDLARILREQGTDYTTLTELWKIPLNKWTQDTHIVNLMMMLKYEAISCDLLGEKYTDRAEALYGILKRYNGMATGTVTGDECLSGISAIQGTELCSVVEQMYSYEWLYSATGNKKWAERLEKIAFNALPATISDDMWSHQYVQMTNQIDCTPFRGNPPFRTNGREAHVFGLEPHFGCCTANFGQGWPKLVLASFMKARDGVVNVLAIPSALSVNWKKVPVKVTLTTDYPFRNTFTYRVEAAEATDMKLKIRIPSFAENLTVNGEAAEKRELLIFAGFEKGVTEITVSYETSARTVSRPNGLYVAEKGSLLFSLPIECEETKVEYVRNNVERKFPYCDYYLKGTSDWNYGFDSDVLDAVEHDVDPIPFSSKNPPLTLKAEMCHVDWGYADGFDTVCAKTPKSRKAADTAREVTLVPYGCAKLRMTEMPKVKK